MIRTTAGCNYAYDSIITDSMYAAATYVNASYVACACIPVHHLVSSVASKTNSNVNHINNLICMLFSYDFKLSI